MGAVEQAMARREAEIAEGRGMDADDLEILAREFDKVRGAVGDAVRIAESCLQIARRCAPDLCEPISFLIDELPADDDLDIIDVGIREARGEAVRDASTH